MKSESKCPGCTKSLQSFSLKAPSGAELALERCTHCGGCWGPRGRIQDTFGPSALHQLVGGLTTRNCVECRILMTPAVLPSGLGVEVCSACRGMFLDAGELAQLGVREPGRAPARSELPRPASTPRPTAPPPPRTAPPPPPPDEHEHGHRHRHEPPANTFTCVECGQHKPLREGQALRDGLACRACMKARMEGR